MQTRLSGRPLIPPAAGVDLRNGQLRAVSELGRVVQGGGVEGKHAADLDAVHGLHSFGSGDTVGVLVKQMVHDRPQPDRADRFDQQRHAAGPDRVQQVGVRVGGADDARGLRLKLGADLAKDSGSGRPSGKL